MFEDNAPQAITRFTTQRVPVSLGVLLVISDGRVNPEGLREITGPSGGYTEIVWGPATSAGRPSGLPPS